jgi:hypothetical protein
MTSFSSLFFRRLHAFAGTLCLLTLSAPAAAQGTSAAEALFNRGLADMKAGRFETGCKALAESQGIDPQPGTLFTLAFCTSQWGHTATAVTYLEEYASLYERLTPAQKAQQGERPKVAKQEYDRLAPRVPRLTLSLPQDAPAGTVVKRDDEVLSASTLGVGSPVDPGEHTVSTQAPGGPIWEQRIKIADGEKQQVTLVVKAPSAVPSSARALPETASTGRRTAAYVAGGVGVAGIVVGAVTGALTLGKKGDITDHCGSGIGQSNEAACDATGFDAASAAQPLGLVSTIGFGVGLAGIGVAAVLVLTGSKQASPTASLPARRVSVGVLGAGPAGALVGLRGAW